MSNTHKRPIHLPTQAPALVACLLIVLGQFGGTARADTGQDNVGFYEWADSSEASVAYEWYDVTAGAQVTLGHADLSSAVSLPFVFPYYLESYSSVYISSAGVLAFVEPAPANVALPGVMPGQTEPALVAGLWSDLDPSAGGQILHDTLGMAPNRIFVVSFEDVPSLDTTELVTFQFVLYESGDIQVNIQESGFPEEMAIDVGLGIVDPHNVAGIQAVGPTVSDIANEYSVRFWTVANAENVDLDWVPYHMDNCPLVDNPQQTDTDADGLGDACDACLEDPDNDVDGDGVCGEVDNCPSDDNAAQTDTDGDGLGDACDPCPDNPADDPDGDLFCGADDNCPEDANPDQADLDGDGQGDVCDACPADAANDGDFDGVCADTDNCPEDANADQADLDGDGLGNVCDPEDNTPAECECDNGCGCAMGANTPGSMAGMLLLALLVLLMLRRRVRS